MWSFLERGSAALVSLVVQIVLARILSPDTFGLLAILLVVTSVADSIAQSGLGLALIQDSEADDASFDTAFWLSLAIAAVIYIAIFLFAPTIAAFYSMPELTQCLRVISLVIFFNAANSIQRAYLQKTMNFRGIFIVSLIASLISGIVGIAAALHGLELWALVIQTVTSSVATCFVMKVAVPWKLHFRFKVKDFKRLFGYGWKICITGILNVFYTGISDLIIGKSCSASDLGMYSQGRKYPQAAISVVSNAIANVLFPAFSNAKSDMNVFKDMVQKSLKVGSFVVVPFAMLCAVTAEPLVALLLTDKWLPCVPVFQLVCLGNLFLIMQLVNLRAYMALGYSNVYMNLQIIKVVNGIVFIGGTAFFTHDIYSTAIAVCIISLFNIIVVDAAPANKLLGYGRFKQLCDQVPVLLLSLVSAAVVWPISLLDITYGIQLILQVVVFGLIYLGGAKVMKYEPLDIVIEQVKALHSK